MKKKEEEEVEKEEGEEGGRGASATKIGSGCSTLAASRQQSSECENKRKLCVILI